VVAKRTELDLSRFMIMLLEQNQACREDKHDSRVDTGTCTLFDESNKELCVVSILVLLYIVGFSNVRIGEV